MSAKSSLPNKSTCGTNSPPMEDQKPMGRASVDKTFNAGHISDGEQRKEYFPDLEKGTSEQSMPDKNQARKMGQSMADTMDQRTK